MLASASSICGIPILVHLPSWCTLKFTACFVVLHSTVHNHGRAANFINTTITKWKLAVNALRKVKSIKTTVANAHVILIAKSNQGLM
jgi:hypothetical protein